MRILKLAVGRCWTNKRGILIFEKVNVIVKENIDPFKNTCKYAHYWL